MSKSVHLHILRGRNLVIKDLTSSDPFVCVYYRDHGLNDYIFQSKCKVKTLEPAFNDKFTFELTKEDSQKMEKGESVDLTFRLFDDDGMHGEDSMGTFVVSITTANMAAAASDGGGGVTWYKIGPGDGDYFCSNASGELGVKISVQ